MGKMLNMLLLVVAIQFALILFHSGAIHTNPGEYLDCNTVGVDCGGEGIENQTVKSSVLNNLIFNPSLWNNDILLLFFGNLATVGGLILGTFWIKNDFVVMAVMVGSIFSFGYPIFQLWSIVSSEIGMFGATGYVGGFAVSGLIASMIFFPIILGYIWTVIDWWRGRD